MGDSTIEWTEKTWNPLVGCAYVSEGCRGCYAARDAYGRLKGNPTDGDRIADALEAAASDSDLANALLFLLVARVRGWDEGRTGVEFVADSYGPSRGPLWTPSG